MSERFLSAFRQVGAPASRGKYLSRIFGIFSEDIVRLWASNPRAPYEDIGRPTVRTGIEAARSTLDFTLRHRQTGRSYVAELKCEIEYQGYRYTVLSDVKQLEHHTKAAFIALLEAAARNRSQQIFVKGKELQVDGAILIWGAATAEGRRAVMEAKGFFDVLTIAGMMSDLRSWECISFCAFLEQRRLWANEMFDALIE